MIVVTRDETSQDASRKGSKESGRRRSKVESEELDLGLKGRKGLRESEGQRPTSTHSSLYDCSITAGPEEQSTRTSSPFSCASCRNVAATESISENDRLEAEIHDLIRSSPQPGSGSADERQIATDSDSVYVRTPHQRQEIPVDADTETSNNSQSLPSRGILPNFSKSTDFEKSTQDGDITMHSTVHVDNLALSKVKELQQTETSGFSAGLGLPRFKTPEMSDPSPQVTEDLPSSMLPPPNRVAPAQPSPSQSPPALVGSSAHDATSTISSSEAPEDSTTLSLQQSLPNTLATSISTHTQGLDRDRAQSDLGRLHNELATAKVRGDSRAVQDTLKQSIGVIRRTYLTRSTAEDSNAPAKFPSPRLGKKRSNLMRFPSLSGSTKGVALGDFAASGNKTSLEKILKEKVNVDSRSDNFETPLMRAAMHGHIECMNLLRQSGADESAVDAKGRTALHIAVASNRLAAVKWLLETYPPPGPEPLKHRTSIMFRATDVVKGVRSQKNLREASDAEGSKPLHIAAELDKGAMVKMLITAHVDIESKDNWGRTPLHRAIISKSRDSIDALFRSGAKMTASDAKSVSPLHMAAQAGEVDIVENLLAKGAKRWDFDTNGYLPIHSAVWGGNPLAIEVLVTERADLEKRTKLGETLLHLACLKRDLEIAKHLLAELVDVNPWAPPSSEVLQILSHIRIKGSSMTPLQYACCVHDFEMAVLLLDHEALVNVPTPEGATALMMAVETEDTNLVNLLLQRGAKVNAKVPGSLITALHLAARRGDLETVQQLCRHGADDKARTKGSSYGRSPLEECAKCPDKKKGQAVESYLRTSAVNRLKKGLIVKPRSHQASNLESFYQPYSSSLGAQTQPLANPVSYGPWPRAQHGYSPDQQYIAQQAQAQNPQYYHPDFDVPDEILPAYEPSASTPARFTNQAPVHRENYA